MAILKALDNRIPAADIRTARFPNKEVASIYNDPRWRRLMGELLIERGRICQDANHAYNRTHQLKNALPDSGLLGRIYGDHIVELVDGGEPFDKHNILLRCAVCHGRKTANAGLERRNTKYKAKYKPHPPGLF